MRGGHATYWTRMGQGNRRALMLHCSLAHSGAWKGVASVLGEQLDMRAFDLPGHGRSADWDGLRDMQEQSVAIAVDMIGDDGPMDVFGHSFGATVALRLAIEHPELVRSLVLIESVFFAAANRDDPDLSARHAAAMAGYTDAVARGDNEGAAREFLREWGDGTPWDTMPPETRAFMADRIHLVEANDATVLHDTPGLLDKGLIETVTVPVLLIRGGDSSAFVEPVHNAIARRLPDARQAVIEGAGHMVPITHPVETATEIRSFLARVPVALPA
ncbi:MAG: alpha/beta hydrolase [Rhodobacterales bacterium]|nr:MAG: alpha/beta hydrolase [Rhodobacterales bacterium]